MSSIQEESLFISSECTTINDCQDILCILSDNEDSENHRINMILYHYAKAIKSLSSNPSFAEMLIESATLDVNSLGVSIHQLAAQDELFLAALNEALRQSINHENVFPRLNEDFNEQENISKYLIEHFLYHDEQYVPVIYFVKQPNSNEKTDFDIFIGEEASECDEVVGWVNNQPTIASENQILESNELNLFIGVGEVLTSNHFNAVHIGGSSNPSDLRMMNVNIDYTSYQIKKGYRYERSKNSEVKGFRQLYFPETENPTSLGDWFKENIHKNDINNSKIFNEQDFAFSMSLSDFNRNREAFFGAWENDWYASTKLIMNDCSEWIKHSVTTKRKFSHEWYFYTCGDLNNFFPSVKDELKEENAKCAFEFLRTQ